MTPAHPRTPAPGHPRTPAPPHPRTGSPAVSFVIPVKDDAERLEHCLRGIWRNESSAGIEVIVADNGSTDGSAAVAQAARAVVLELAGSSLGELRNRAAAVARGRILAFVDADNEIGPDWVAACVESLNGGRTAAVGAPYRPPTPSTWVQRSYDRLRRHPTAVEHVDWLGSGNLAVRRSVFEEVGGFDSTLETCEDVDLCRKIRGRGYTVASDSRLSSVHHGDPRTLRELFSGELWRGRDNVRVSLRAPRSWRTVASAVVPVLNLVALLLTFAGLLAISTAGVALAGGAAAFLGLAIGLRATIMVRARFWRDWPAAVAVAAAYEAGRALALVGRFGHGRRREPVPARGVA